MLTSNGFGHLGLQPPRGFADTIDLFEPKDDQSGV
jgi:hypothetical protein